MTTNTALPVLPELFPIWQQTLHWQPDPQQQQQFQHLYQRIWIANQTLNLTRITQPKEFWEKHLWDSLRGIVGFLEGMGTIQNPGRERSEQPFRVIDIGTGAGFPGTPIAIARPDWNVTLLDSTRKKIAFLQTLLAISDLDNIIPLIGRAEHIGRQSYHRGTYDLALVRAVGTAAVCAEYAFPLLKVGGLAVLYRGQWSANDTTALKPVVEKLSGTLETVEAFTTPLSQSQRHCLYLRKVASGNSLPSSTTVEEADEYGRMQKVEGRIQKVENRE